MRHGCLDPGLGLAWDLFGNGKTAIRSGFGIYYSLIDALSFQLNSLPPYNGSVSFTNASLPSLLPVLPNVPPPPSCGPGIPQPCTIYAPSGVQPDAKTPTVEEWNFTIEQELSHNTALRAAYVGSHGYHGLLSVDPNSIPAAICSNPSGCVTGGVAPSSKRLRSARRAIYSRRDSAQPLPGSRILLEYRGQQQL